MVVCVSIFSITSYVFAMFCLLVRRAMASDNYYVIDNLMWLMTCQEMTPNIHCVYKTLNCSEVRNTQFTWTL
jgi:hypothetical protein